SDDRRLLSGQYARMHLLDPGKTREVAGRPLVVAGDQTRANAELVKAAHRIRRVGAQCVAQREQTQERAVPRNADHREPLFLELVYPRTPRVETHAFRGEKSRAAGDDRGAA